MLKKLTTMALTGTISVKALNMLLNDQELMLLKAEQDNWVLQALEHEDEIMELFESFGEQEPADELTQLFLNPTAEMSMKEMVEAQGLVLEKHEVTTKDGYILGLYRIPGTLGESAQGKPPVLMVHGLSCDMVSWVYAGPSKAPAFVMAKQGYDVWLGNNRGNRFSQKHVSLKTNTKQYWAFDWEEMGEYDVPTWIDYITDLTGYSKVSYIGHSEGTTQLMAGASLMPDYYKEKINVAVLLAPPTSMYHNENKLFKEMAQVLVRKTIAWFVDKFKMWNLTPHIPGVSALASKSASVLCSKWILDGKLCTGIAGEIGLHESDTNDPHAFTIAIANLPAGAGWRNFMHYGQLTKTEKPVFRRYDYDWWPTNNEHYGQWTPPDYDLSVVDFPVAIFYGSQDVLATPKDVEWLAGQLGNHVTFIRELNDFDHQSFQIAKDMSYFTQDGMSIFNYYNDKCDASTANSGFKPGNDKCRSQNLQNLQLPKIRCVPALPSSAHEYNSNCSDIYILLI